MKKILCEAYHIGDVNHLFVTNDNVKDLNIYEKLNILTDKNWTYTVDNILYNKDNISVIITLFLKGKTMTGVGDGNYIKEAVEKALNHAYNIIFNNNKITSNDTSKIIKEDNTSTLQDYVPLDNNIQSEYPTIEEIDLKEEETSKINEDDDKCPISGSNITNRQIRFMNEFKEHNQIDTEEKFDYYVKTWSSNQAIDDINTKKELIKAGYDTLDSFISWIKVMQPILDNGIVSPI